MTAVSGKRLKQVREARNLSLQQLADDAGVNLSTLWRIESGRTVPSTDTARKIAETLGVSTLWLLGESDTEDDQFSLMNLSGDERLPIDAVAALHRIKPPQRLFNSWNFGGYLIYFARDYPVFIDGRADLYRAFTWEYIAIHRADPGWQDDLAKWDVNSVLIEPETPLAGALRTEPGWSIAYEDAVAVLFVRG